MRRAKIFTIFTVMLVSMLVLGMSSVQAKSFSLGKNSSSNEYLSTGAGPDTDHSYYNYYLDGEQAWCMEAGVGIRKGANYSEGGQIPNSAVLSYVMLSGADDQLKQAAVWQLVGVMGINGSHVTNPNARLNNFLDEAIAATSNQSGAVSQWINPTGGNMSYDEGTNTYRMYFDASGQPNVSRGWVEHRGGNSYTLIVNAADFDQDIDVTMDLPGSGSRRIYDNATMWVSSGLQTLITPNAHDEAGAGASASYHIEAVGNLKVQKKDEWGNPVAGCRFTATGPSGTNTNLVTDGNGWAEWKHIKRGNYTVTETYVPANLILNTTPQTKYVGNGTTRIGVAQFVDYYQRGKVKLKKYDNARRFFNMNKTLGDAKIYDAVYNFYAAEDIWEGAKLRYSRGQLIKSNIHTDGNGDTPEIGNLPVGHYYYQEVQASEGFDLNPNIVDAYVTYNGMNAQSASSNSYEHAENPKWYSIEINKKLKESDYDNEANLSLHDLYHSFTGVRFKLTLKSDPTQVYYTHGSTVVNPDARGPEKYAPLSGDDGLCLAENIPYGVYTVEEVEWPNIVTEPVASWDVDFRDDNPIIDSNRKATFTKERKVVDTPKKISIEVNKKLILAPGEDTDAKIEGAYFTIYRDAACQDTANIVDVIGPTNREGYAKLNGYVWAGTYYMKETTFPEGIDPDSPVMREDGTFEDVTYRNKIYVLECGPEKQTDEFKLYHYDIINVPKRNDIQIKKMIEGTANTERLEFQGCVFTAYLKSSIGTDHEFSREVNDPTDYSGWAMIEDLPYGEYIVKETFCPDISLPCSDFTINIKLDRKEKSNPSWYEPTEGVFTHMTQVIDGPTGAIVDPRKTMVIKIRKVDSYRTEEDEPDFTSGDTTLKGAKYAVYGLDEETNEFKIHVDDITIDKQDSDGYWYGESAELASGSYMVKELAQKNDIIAWAEGYLIDEKAHYFYSNPTVQKSPTLTVTEQSVDTPFENDIEIIKEVESTNSSDVEYLEGAEFTASLISTDGTSYEKKKSAMTNAKGYCKIEGLPYGTYLIEETVVPDGATACEPFTIKIDQDRRFKSTPYTPADSEEAKAGDLKIDPTNNAIIDTPKTMDIKIRKVDSEWNDTINPDSPRGDASLKGAVYEIYRYSKKTTDYTTYVDTMTVDKKDDAGYWYAEYDNLKIGKYMVVEKSKNDYGVAFAPGYLIDANKYYYEVEDTPDTPLHTSVNENNNTKKIRLDGTEVTDVTVNLSKDAVLKNKIVINKMLQETSNSQRKELAGAQFTAILISSLDENGQETRDTLKYYSGLTDDKGHCEIVDLPYGIYRVEETTVPQVALKCSDFIINIEKDYQEKPEGYNPAVDGTFEGTNQIIDADTLSIVDFSKKMKIKLKKVDAEKKDVAAAATSGDADLKGAIYEVYKFNDQTNEYDIQCADIEVKEKDENGYWYAETEPLELGKYKVVEKAKDGEYSYAEGYLIDHNEYIFEQDEEEQEGEYSYHEDTSEEKSIKNDIVIVKGIGETSNTTLESLAGAQFTATLVSSKGTTNEVKYESTITDDNGKCKITDLPYGLYEIEETVVPDSTFKCSNFKIFIEKDKSDKVIPYNLEDAEFVDPNQRLDNIYGIIDTPKTMDIKLRKVDFNRPEGAPADWKQGDADLQNAVYRIYAQDEKTGEYNKFVQELVINQKDAEGYWYGEVTGLKTGNYMAIEKAQENGIYSYATGYKVDKEEHYFKQNPAEQHEERVTLTNISYEKIITNNIEITKKIDETTNTKIAPLDKCQFTATLVSDPTKKYVSTETDENGYCIIKDLPYGEYEVEETKVSPIALKCSNFTVFIADDQEIKNEAYGPTDGVFKLTSQKVDDDGSIIDTPKVMDLKIRKTDKDRTNEEVDWTQGDAQLEGAQYEIYRYNPETNAYDEYVDFVTIDHKDSDGYWCAEYKEVLVGQYMMTERTAFEDENGVKYSHAKGYKVDEEIHYFESKPDEQQERVVQVTQESKEDVVRGTVETIKMVDEQYSTEENPAKGAILRLSLQSDPSIYYEVTIDKDGYGMFMDTNDDTHSTSVKTNYGKKYGKYSIPYGTYVITETRESDSGLHLSYYIYPEKNVTVFNQDEIEKRIEMDDIVPVKLKIHKYDAETNQTIVLPGAKFKIWDKRYNRFVTQRIAGSGEYKDEFVTNKSGYLQLPDEVEAGYYVIYELDTPDGYYLEDKYRLPEDPEDYGNTDVAGLEVAITKRATSLPEDAQDVPTREVFFDAGVGDRPLMAKLEIYKTGEVFTGVESKSLKVEGSLYEVNTPIFETKGLKGVEFTISAAKDIYTNDGTKRYSKGQAVDVITTDENGYATTKELYLGEYSIEETKTPLGYITEENIDNVVLTNEDNTERVKLHTKDIDNKRQNNELIFNKYFDDLEYLIGDPAGKYAVFGVYAGEDLKDYQGNVQIREDQMVDIFTAYEGENSRILNLPDGEYYYKEVYSTYPYDIESGTIPFVINHSDTTSETHRIQGEPVYNGYEYGDLYLAKFSTSDFIKENGVTLYSEDSGLAEAEEEIQAYMDELNQLVALNNDIEEIESKIKTDKIAMLSGAEYSIYLDEECTTPLKRVNENGEIEEVKIITDGGVLYKMDGIPLGTYYLKEEKAPTYDNKGSVYEYEISKDIVKVDVNPTQSSNIVIRALYDMAVKYEIEKIDIFTGKLVPDCLFTITDEAGTELVRFVTDEDGKAYIPTDIFENGEYYYFTELEAKNPFYYDENGKLYELDTEPHRFQAHVDEEGKWQLSYIDEDGNIVNYEKPVVFNYRPTSTVTLTKLDIMDSQVVPNCKFELRSKETDWVVEGVTDENGIYVFENVPYGEYTYTELEAPEEYLIDTTPHDITINTEETTIVVKDLRAPIPFIDVNTSDIAVAGIAVVMIASVFGIVFIVRKKTVSNR